MRLIVVAVLCALAGTASAKPCVCATDLRLPELKRNPADTTPPRAPSGLFVMLMTSDASLPPSIGLHGDYAPDTAFVRVEIEHRGGSTMFATRIENLYLCSIGEPVALGDLTVRVSAIDIAGNESAPFVTTTHITALDYEQSTCDATGAITRVRPRCGTGAFIAMLFYGGVGAIVLVWLLIIGINRLYATDKPAEPISLLAAEAVTVRMRRWLLVWSSFLLAAPILLFGARADVVAFLFVPGLAINLWRVYYLQRVLAALDHPNARAARHGRWLRVTTSRGEWLVRADEWDFVMAERANIPRSVVR